MPLPALSPLPDFCKDGIFERFFGEPDDFLPLDDWTAILARLVVTIPPLIAERPPPTYGIGEVHGFTWPAPGGARPACAPFMGVIISGDANRSGRGSPLPFCARRLVTCRLNMVWTGDGQGTESCYHPLSAASFFADELSPQKAFRVVGDFAFPVACVTWI